MHVRGKKIWLSLGMILMAIAAIVAIRSAVWWKQYPVPPDIATADPRDVFAFIGSEQFNRMTESHRDDYCMAFVNRLKDRTFAELVTLLADPKMIEPRERVIANIRRLPHDNRIGYALYALFIEKFYELPTLQRKAMMITLSVFQGTDVTKSSLRFFIPYEGKTFENHLSDLMANHSPHVQALSFKFLLDMKTSRQMLGFNDPF